jgi:hypothetical protein
VRIPHLYNGRGKTFFFVNYDRTAISNSTTVTETISTAAQRKGELSNLRDPSSMARRAHPRIRRNDLSDHGTIIASICR